jgi:putative ABC transport system permease protein
VRTAIGASRSRVVAQLFGEALVLAGVAGLAGITLAQVGLSLGFGILETETGVLPFWFKRGLSIELVTSTVVLTLLTAAIVGIVPALQATGGGLPSGLRQLSTGVALRLGGTWTVLIVAQVALAMLALPMVVSNAWRGGFGQGLRQPNFPASEFVVAPLAITPQMRPGSTRQLIDRLEQEPGVGSVTFSAGLVGLETGAEIEIEGASATEPAIRQARAGRVDVGFLDALGSPLLAGRAFEAADAGSAANPILVNRTFVEQVLGGTNPLGRRLRYLSVERSGGVQPAPPEGWYEIVGVVGDLHSNRVDAALDAAVFYHPMALPDSGSVVLVARVRGGSAVEMASRFRDIASAIDPAMRVRNVRPISELDRQEQIVFRLISLAFGLVTLSVLLLSGAGVYAMMAFTVSQRRKEIGIRSALGAEPGQVLRSVFARAGRQLGGGLFVGIAIAAALEVASGGEVFGGRGLLFVPVIALLLVLAGLLAAIGPARRGLRVDATEALKAE